MSECKHEMVECSWCGDEHFCNVEPWQKRIKVLEAENAKLREALEYFAKMDVSAGNPHWSYIQKAQAALLTKEVSAWSNLVETPETPATEDLKYTIEKYDKTKEVSDGQ